MQLNQNFYSLTPFTDINIFIETYTRGVTELLYSNIVGIYLTGSLSYGDFNYNSSDIDITNITEQAITVAELELIKKFHCDLLNDFPVLSRRFESTYTPKYMLKNISPPTEPRPWYFGGEEKLYEKAQYGNEWIINNYLLYNYSITLAGTAFQNICNEIPIVEVQKACINDYIKEWKEKIYDLNFLDNDHYAAYFVLNLCRIYYTINNAEISSKKVSANWVKQKFTEWNDLISKAQGWEYDKDFKDIDEIINFAKFIFTQIENSTLYKQISIPNNIAQQQVWQ
jgi:predicted nucleotidyltransferase